MKRHFFLNAAVILSAVALICSCGSKPKGAVLLPEDAQVVTCIDVEETMEASELGGDRQFKEKVRNSIKQMGFSRIMEKQITDIVEDPSTTGIDFKEPFFYAVLDIDRMLFAFTGSLNDSEKFESLLRTTMMEMNGDSTLQPTVANPNVKFARINGDAFILFDNDGFIICNKNYDEDEAGFVEYMAKQFSEEKNYSQTKGYDMLMDENGIAKMHIACGKILASQNMKMSLDRLPAETKKKIDLFYESDVIMALNVSKGEASYVCTFDPGTDEAKKYYDKMCESAGEIKGTFLKYIDKDALMAAAMNFNGKKYIELQDEQLNNILGQISMQNAGEIKDLIKTINGDFTIGIGSKLLGSKKVPEMKIYGSTDNNKLVNYIAEMSNGDMVKSGDGWMIKMTESDYTEVNGSYDWVENEIGQASLGYKGNASYFTISEKGNDAFKASGNAIDKSDFKGNKFYMRLNFAPMLKMKEVEEMLGRMGEGEIIRDVIKEINYAEMTVENNYKAEIRLVMNDKDHTPIAIAIDIFKELLL